MHLEVDAVFMPGRRNRAPSDECKANDDGPNYHTGVQPFDVLEVVDEGSAFDQIRRIERVVVNARRRVDFHAPHLITRASALLPKQLASPDFHPLDVYVENVNTTNSARIQKKSTREGF